MDLNNISPEEVQKFLESLPTDVRESVAHLIRDKMAGESIKHLKHWINEAYDENCPIDNLVALTAVKFVFSAGDQLTEEAKALKAEGINYFPGLRASQVIKRVLQEILDNIHSAEARTEEDGLCQKNH